MEPVPAAPADGAAPVSDDGVAGRPWRPMSRATVRSGYVVVLCPTRTGDRLYWCGHAGWDSFVNWLFYRDPRTDAEVPAPVSVYTTRMDAMVAWDSFLADRRARRIPPPSDVVRVVSLGQIDEVAASPRAWPPTAPQSTEGPYDV